MVSLGPPMDPMRLTGRSVDVRAPDGQALPARCTVQAGRLVVELIVDGALLDSAPATLRIRLAGLPSPHALGTLDGQWLGKTAVLDVALAPGRLVPAGPPGVRLVSVAGRPVPPPTSLPLSGALTLVFDGVLDPGSLGPGSFPLFPVEQGLVLGQAVDPTLRWRCIGRRFEVELDVRGLRGQFELDLRQCRMRDLSGAAPQPALKTLLTLS